jgi:YVTN family beta-propeller protein
MSRSAPQTALVTGALLLAAARPAPAAPFAYVTTFRDYVSVIDLATGMHVTAISTGGGESYWIAASRDGSLVAASLHDNTGIALLDPSTHTRIATVGLPAVNAEPEAIAVNGNGTTVFVADETNDTLSVIDVASRTIVAGPIAVTGCSEPENMVISPDDSALYIACANGGSSSTVRVGATSPYPVSLVANTSGDTHGIALNSTGTRLYYGDGGNTVEYDTAMGLPTGKTFTGCELYNGALSPDDSRLFCVEEASTLEIYDVATGNLLGSPIPLGSSSATGVAALQTGSPVYVAVSSGSLVEVSPATQAVTNTLAVMGDNNPNPRDVVIVREATPTTTTTTAVPATTTTTLAGCVRAPTFASLNCRLAALIAQVDAESTLGNLKRRLLNGVRQAKKRKEKAEATCRNGKRPPASRELRKSFRKMASFVALLRSRRGRQVIPDGVRATIGDAATPIRDDLKALRSSVRCPDDAA